MCDLCGEHRNVRAYGNVLVCYPCARMAVTDYAGRVPTDPRRPVRVAVRAEPEPLVVMTPGERFAAILGRSGYERRPHAMNGHQAGLSA